MHRSFPSWCPRDCLLQFLCRCQPRYPQKVFQRGGPTNFSNTQALSVFSGRRQCQSCWLLLSRHSQCFRNSVKHDLLISLNLAPITISTTLPLSPYQPSEHNSHTRRTSRDLSTLPHAIHFALSICVCLANHIVIIVGLASGTDEVGSAEERSGAGADFGHFGDRVGEGSGVNEDLLVEPDSNSQWSGIFTLLESVTYMGWRAAMTMVGSLITVSPLSE